MKYDVIVGGGGIAGLTAATYLSKAGISTLVCEKEAVCGGLVNTFERDGFIYDGGIRAFENSGVLLPMLRQLGIDLNLVKNKFSIGIEDRVIRINSEEDLKEYQRLLDHFYPQCRGEIQTIIEKIQEIMHYMGVQYGIDNPVFLDMQKDREYMLKAILPWMFKYAWTAPKISKLNEPVVDYLKHFTQDQSLQDIIAQHFFQETPAFFALSYLRLYLDYYYPKGGTGKLVEKLVEVIQAHGGVISNQTEITALDPVNRMVVDQQGREFQYKKLIWAADLQTLYRLIDPGKIPNYKTRLAVYERKNSLSGKKGNDSVFTLYLGVNLPKEYFSKISSEHFFYTSVRTGQSAIGPYPVLNASVQRGQARDVVEEWLKKFFALTTYEISIPVLRDSSMAPPGKTGLIISVLFDYQLTKSIEEQGWYESFKAFCETCILNTLNSTVYPGIRESIHHQFSSTPLSMAKLAGTHEGAITGWAFTNRPIPAESRLPRIANAIATPIPGIYQAGQWTYSPSGFPIALITGKMAADRAARDI